MCYMLPATPIPFDILPMPHLHAKFMAHNLRGEEGKVCIAGTYQSHTYTHNEMGGGVIYRGYSMSDHDHGGRVGVERRSIFNGSVTNSSRAYHELGKIKT